MLHDIVNLEIGSVTVEDLERKERTGSIDFFQSEVIHEDGTNVGMYEKCREVYFAMRVEYHRRQPDMIECSEDQQFFIRYIYN